MLREWSREPVDIISTWLELHLIFSLLLLLYLVELDYLLLLDEDIVAKVLVILKHVLLLLSNNLHLGRSSRQVIDVVLFIAYDGTSEPRIRVSVSPSVPCRITWVNHRAITDVYSTDVIHVGGSIVAFVSLSTYLANVICSFLVMLLNELCLASSKDRADSGLGPLKSVGVVAEVVTSIIHVTIR